MGVLPPSHVCSAMRAGRARRGSGPLGLELEMLVSLGAGHAPGSSARAARCMGVLCDTRCEVLSHYYHVVSGQISPSIFWHSLYYHYFQRSQTLLIWTVANGRTR